MVYTSPTNTGRINFGCHRLDLTFHCHHRHHGFPSIVSAAAAATTTNNTNSKHIIIIIIINIHRTHHQQHKGHRINGVTHHPLICSMFRIEPASLFVACQPACLVQLAGSPSSAICIFSASHQVRATTEITRFFASHPLPCPHTIPLLPSRTEQYCVIGKSHERRKAHHSRVLPLVPITGFHPLF